MQPLKTFTTLKYQVIDEKVVHVQFNRAKTLNSMNSEVFTDLIEFFSKFVYTLGDIRAIAITGDGKNFTAGLDLSEFSNAMKIGEGKDQARKGIMMYDYLKFLQKSVTVIEKCKVPVIAGAHGYCLGAGVDLLACCDIRFCEEKAQFSIKEIDIGNVADLGTLQRVPQITGNDSLLRELAMTGRLFGAQEAKELGFVSRICRDKKELEESVIAMAKVIAEKSPVAIWGIKKVLNKNRKAIVKAGLDYVATANMSLISTGDMKESVRANMAKTQPNFPKL